MPPWIVEWITVAACLGGWFGLYGVMLLISRPARVPAGPPHPDLIEHPPALASLLGQGWRLTEDAAEATLVDLAARRVVEFRQPLNDPRHTTIHVLDPTPAGLNRYEQRVFDRIAGLAVDGMVPLTALPFRDKRKAKAWWNELRAEVVADARSRGLSQRRFSPPILGVLIMAVVLTVIGVDAAIVHWWSRQPASDTAADTPMAVLIPTTIVTFFALLGIATGDVGERDTATGRAAAAHWLGLRSWLRAHPAFGDLPPAAVATWDRYLAYGVALGTNHTVSQVIDLGMGNRRLVWSSFGSTWHRVRVSYPRGRLRYGYPVRSLVWDHLILAAVGAVLTFGWAPAVAWVGDHVIEVPRAALVTRFGAGIGVLLLVAGVYLLVRTVIDALSHRTIVGEVLWKQAWRSRSDGDSSPSVPWLYYLAVDDGRSDHTRAWGLPAELAHRCDTGDTVRISVRRWSRRVDEVVVLQGRTPGHDVDTEASRRRHEELVAELRRPTGTRTLTDVALTELLSADEVSRALGFPVIREELGGFGPARTITFRPSDRRRTAVILQVAEGPLAAIAGQLNAKGRPVADLGDGAWVSGNRGGARAGERVVVINLLGPAKGRGDQLDNLLRLVVGRLVGETG